jgi:putative ABC transport system substrate-binding protein
MARRRAAAWLGLCILVAVVAPPAGHAQVVAKSPRIGFLVLGSLTAPETKGTLEAFRQGLRDHGYVEGQSIVVEYRAAAGKLDRLRGLAVELVRLEVDAIVAVATPAAHAAREATSRIPIVAIAMGDPVGDGLVTSLSRPGGNLTGTTFLGPKLVPKHLELVKEALPGVSVVAILWHPRAFAERTTSEMRAEIEAAGRTLRLRLHFAPVEGPDDLERAFSTLARERPEALVVGPSTMLFAARRRIAELAARHRLPSFFNSRQAVESGGMLGYGTSLPALVRRSAAYVDKVVKGARPADLPVEQPTTFELTVNVKTAKALGLTLAPSVLARADSTIR